MAGANMSRNESLAGQSVKQGGYTVTYDKNGYAKKAVKDGGASATSSKKTTHANDSAAHNEAYEAAKRGDWDAVGNAINKISDAGPVDAYGKHDLTDANKYLSELADEYKIHPNKILEWRKVLFESATGIFEQKRPDITEKAKQRKIDALEKTLADKDAVIADIAQENLALKKKLTGRP